MSVLPNLCILVTFQCNVSCKHCGPDCGPEQTDWMSLEEIQALISQAAALRTERVVFSGGEPSLLGEGLPRVIRFARDQRIHKTRVVTNAKFATTYERALRTLSSWRDAGLSELYVSCGEFHQEFIPMGSVANAYRAADDLGFDTVVLLGEFLKPGSGKLEPAAYEAALGGCLPSESLNSPFSDYNRGMRVGEVMPYGRAKHFVNPETLSYLPTEGVRSCCDDVLGVFTAHPNGNLTACCGVMVRQQSLLTVGNWRRNQLSQLAERAHQDLTLNWIRYRGLRDMRAWLEAKEPTLNFRNEYQNICDLCADVLNHPSTPKLLAEADEALKTRVVKAKVATDAVAALTPLRYA